MKTITYRVMLNAAEGFYLTCSTRKKPENIKKQTQAIYPRADITVTRVQISATAVSEAHSATLRGDMTFAAAATRAEAR